MKWDSRTGMYFKTCPVCNSCFTGRKNQVYCNTKCKTKYNNDKQLVRRRHQAILTTPFLRNIEILAHKIGEAGIDEIQVSIHELDTLGFDPSAPRTAFKVRDTGKTWYRYGSYAVCPEEERKMMTISKITENE
jgi:hypothetical protein